MLAKGFITRPDALEPHLGHEMRVLEGPSIDSVRERIDATQPFVIANLAMLEYDAIYEI